MNTNNTIPHIIGIDGLPTNIQNSKIFSANHLQQLGNLSQIPTVNPAFFDDTVKNIVQYYSINPDDMEHELHHYAKQLLDKNEIDNAWQVLLTVDII